MTNIILWQLLNTDLFWTHLVSTLAEVGADYRKGDEVSLHRHVFATLSKHLLINP